MGQKENTNSVKLNISKGKQTGEQIIIMQCDMYWNTGKCIVVVMINSAWGGYFWVGLWRVNRSSPDLIIVTDFSKFLAFTYYLKLQIDILLG